VAFEQPAVLTHQPLGNIGDARDRTPGRFGLRTSVSHHPSG